MDDDWTELLAKYPKYCSMTTTISIAYLPYSEATNANKIKKHKSRHLLQ